MERLKVGGGVISANIVHHGEVIEEDINMSHLRVRSRRATSSDCISFLRPGIDVCVLSESNTENEDDETDSEPVSPM